MAEPATVPEAAPDAATIAERARRALREVPRELLIDGEWRPARDGASLLVHDPATEQPLARVADAGESDALAAAQAAARAQGAWASSAPRERGELLRRIYEAVIADGERLATLITLEMGKPLAEARAEVLYGADFLRWFAEEAVRIHGRHAPNPLAPGRILTSRQPVGPSLLITPWNFPLAMATRKLAPALAAGCTTVLKPAAQTPLTALAFAQLCERAGAPPGVVNLVTTSEPGPMTERMLGSGAIRKLSFTGSTAVGQRLQHLCVERSVRATMELGGNAPLIVFADAELELAVAGALLAKLRNGGESCVAANRIYVQRPLLERFADAFVERVCALRLGHGCAGAEVGPLIDARAVASVHELVADAVRAGARVRCGGAPCPGAGHFYPPTVLQDVPAGASLLEREIFGPVAPLVAFDGEDEAVAAANATPYGLAAYVFSGDLDRALRVAGRLDTGMVGVNQGIISNAAAPFGGVKASGLGREGGDEGIDAFLETQYLALPTPATVAVGG
jgi:succinate-semialdehyde dehydrogenase/glutarate-semialdehyde dehydrogenase